MAAGRILCKAPLQKGIHTGWYWLGRMVGALSVTTVIYFLGFIRSRRWSRSLSDSFHGAHHVGALWRKRCSAIIVMSHDVEAGYHHQERDEVAALPGMSKNLLGLSFTLSHHITSGNEVPMKLPMASFDNISPKALQCIL